MSNLSPFISTPAGAIIQMQFAKSRRWQNSWFANRNNLTLIGNQTARQNCHLYSFELHELVCLFVYPHSVWHRFEGSSVRQTNDLAQMHSSFGFYFNWFGQKVTIQTNRPKCWNFDILRTQRNTLMSRCIFDISTRGREEDWPKSYHVFLWWISPNAYCIPIQQSYQIFGYASKWDWWKWCCKTKQGWNRGSPITKNRVLCKRIINRNTSSKLKSYNLIPRSTWTNRRNELFDHAVQLGNLF